MKRRSFLYKSGISGLGFLGISLISPVIRQAIAKAASLKITKIETIRFSKNIKINGMGIQWMWLRLHTNEGIIGTGETYPFNEASEAVFKDLEWHSWAGKLLGANPLEIEQVWDRIYKQNAFNIQGGAEMRALSALNIAQWDMLGQASNMPIYKLLGGSINKHIRVYNTYTNGRSINGWTIEKDLDKIARFLVDKGIKTIKFCPFDSVATRNNGEYISRNEIESCLDMIRTIRDAVGDDLEIGCEFHSYWNLPSAIRIAKSLEQFNILFLEDMLLQDNIKSYISLAQETPIPMVISERLATRFGFREFFEAGIGGVAMYDLTWCGGISEGKKISDMANTYYLPTMMHTAGGPILWYASAHLASAITNLFFVESVYPNWTERYPYFFENVPQVVNGIIKPPEEPGLGLKFKKGLFDSDDIIVETIAEI